MKEQIEKMYIQALIDDLPPNVFAGQVLRLFAVSGMFSSDKLEQAYKDGVKDALTKGYGTFNEENYR